MFKRCVIVKKGVTSLTCSYTGEALGEALFRNSKQMVGYFPLKSARKIENGEAVRLVRHFFQNISNVGHNSL